MISVVAVFKWGGDSLGILVFGEAVVTVCRGLALLWNVLWNVSSEKKINTSFVSILPSLFVQHVDHYFKLSKPGFHFHSASFGNLLVVLALSMLLAFSEGPRLTVSVEIRSWEMIDARDLY